MSMKTPEHEPMDESMTGSTTDQSKVDEETSRKKKYTKWAIRAGVITTLIIVIIVAAVNSAAVVSALEDFLEWVGDNGFLGAVAFSAAYVLATVFFLPGLILTVGSGFVFGQAFGTGVGLLIAAVVVLIGATIGACIAFLLARTVLREIVTNYAAKNPKFSAVDQAIGDEGFKMIFLLRLSPLIPFNAFNYFAGITSVPFRSYLFASVGMIPGTVVYCFVGTTIGELSDAASAGLTSGGTVTLVLIIVGSILAIISVGFVSYKAKNAINRAVEEAQERRDREGGDVSQSGGDLEEGSRSGVEGKPSAPSETSSERQAMSIQS